ncbi:MAG: hypothetical protein P8Z35_11040, partial [Ignavibacteriaceae bacterium]
LKISRIATVIIGIVAVFMAFYVQKMGDIFTYSQKLINMFTGPLFGVFLLGMLTKKATSSAALIAGFVGFVMGSLMVFAKQLSIDSLAVGVLWPATVSFAITMILGYGLSFIIGKNDETSLNYTRKKVLHSES